MYWKCLKPTNRLNWCNIFSYYNDYCQFSLYTFKCHIKAYNSHYFFIFFYRKIILRRSYTIFKANILKKILQCEQRIVIHTL